MAHKEDFTTKNRLTNPAFLFYNDVVKMVVSHWIKIDLFSKPLRSLYL